MTDRRAATPYDAVDFSDLASLRAWLEEHHGTSPGIWGVTGKKGSGSYIAYPDLVRELLRVGWIDSQPRRVDELRTSRLFTPRRPTSSWSRVNKAHIEALERSGDLHPGLPALPAVNSETSDYDDGVASPCTMRAHRFGVTNTHALEGRPPRASRVDRP